MARNFLLAAGLALALSGCQTIQKALSFTSTASTVATTAQVDATSALDTAVKSLAAVDRGLTLCGQSAACSSKPLYWTIVADAHTAKAKLEAAQKATASAADVTAALASLASVANSFASL